MQSYWVEFTDGTAGCCDGQRPIDALGIAEHVTGKKVKVKLNADRFKPEGVSTLPYPALPTIWGFDHPVYGRCPTFCYTPEECKGQSCCLKSHACDD